MISRIQILKCRGVGGFLENHSPLVSSFLSSVFDDPPAEVAVLSSAATAVAVDDGGLLLPAAEPLLPDPPIMFFVGDTTKTTMCCRVYISTDDGRTREVDAEFLDEHARASGGGTTDRSVEHAGDHRPSTD